ncbi:hypothetical protein [uncultured Paracoccus sp.]|uniref:hypothetical protein n=1 Tax=uncultured Paracoccus sp. TaxID=189685 RepID=UPI002611FEE4|nr:hypothetical protein [uncultured Paracoccus sp.]
MSACLSAANSVAGASHRELLAEMQRAQFQLLLEWQRIWLETWTAICFPAGQRK